MTTLVQDDNSIRAQRYMALRLHPSLMGIDHIDYEEPVSSIPFSLSLFFFHKASGNPSIPPGLVSSNFVVKDADGVLVALQFDETDPIVYNPSDAKLTLKFKNSISEYLIYNPIKIYTIELINVPNLDPFFAKATFRVGYTVTNVDALNIGQELKKPQKPEIDYLAKDYASFRTLMLDRISRLNPTASLDNPADFSVAIVETLAYAADQLSYYQDAVGTEAYLSTARQRISVKRHARMLDYAVHEGCNARTWIQIETTSSEGVDVQAGTQLITQTPGYPSRIFPASTDYARILEEKIVVFETMDEITVYKQKNTINIYTWGATTYSLPQGATSATLYLDPALGAGTVLDHLIPDDILIFQEMPITGSTGEELLKADIRHRHAVRLTKVTHATDPLGGSFMNPPNDNPVPVTHIEWSEEDALPFELEIAFSDVKNRTIVLGNIVLADHGRTYHQQPLQPDKVPDLGNYRPVIAQPDLTSRTFYQPAPASAMLTQDVHNAYHADLILTDSDGQTWNNKIDLLKSQYLDLDFMVEINNTRQAIIRFGDDAYGKKPTLGTHFKANYRIGNGTAGNIGADSLVHIVVNQESITKVTNPLPAIGGIDPEPIEHVRLYAPHAFKKQRRCVTLQDYIEIAQQFPGIQQAVAAISWMGSWHTIQLTLLRENSLPLTNEFLLDFNEYIQEFRLIGHELEIVPARFVPADIILVVHIKPGQPANVIKRRLQDHFSARILADGSRGFFHPDNFGLGRDLYFSQVIDAALTVPGVAWIDVTSPKSKFRAQQIGSIDAQVEGVIKIKPFEVIQAMSDLSHFEKGGINFIMETDA